MALLTDNHLPLLRVGRGKVIDAPPTVKEAIVRSVVRPVVPLAGLIMSATDRQAVEVAHEQRANCTVAHDRDIYCCAVRNMQDVDD